MASWTADDELTTTKDFDDMPRSSVFGRMNKSDEITLQFHDNGEIEEREDRNQVAFKVTLEESTFRPMDWDEELLAEGDDFIFETPSSAFLSKITPHAEADELEGCTVAITRNYDGSGPPEDYYTVDITEAEDIE